MVNEHYLQATDTYLFANVAIKTRAFKQANPDTDLIEMHVGDVSRPLTPAVRDALLAAAREMASEDTPRGYGPEQGYSFLRDAIHRYYADLGVEILTDEIFVSEGTKGDIGGILDLFSRRATTVIPEPSYTAYADANRMEDRRVILLQGNEKNGFLPMPAADMAGDIIYLCSPANPTGAAYDRVQLSQWVDFANKNGAVILFDAAYEAFVTDKSYPRSIFEVEGARTCAIEFCSLSKTAGFTGLRCGYTVVPHQLCRDGLKLRRMWLRNRTVKHNGVSYPVQRAAEAALSEAGRRENEANVSYYLENARLITDMLTRHGVIYTGGSSSPYVWFKCPLGMSSWAFFDLVLEKAGVIGTPGVCYGEAGEGYFRLCAFGDRAQISRGVARLDALFFELEGQLRV